MIATIAAQQVLAFRRQRVFAALIGTLLVMTALAGVIGWSSHNTIIRVYDESVRFLAQSGKPAPPNPFILKPRLSLLSNMVVYVPLIGALLALVLGHVGLADDETTGIGRIIFSRPISRADYVAAKILAAAGVLAIAIGASLLVSVGSLLIVNRGMPTLGELGRLTAFYAVSWLYLLTFALIGMAAVLLSRRRSLSLLSGIGAWLVVTFALPQFSSGLRPTQSLNPITDPVSTSQAFFRVTANLRPISIVEQYKAFSGQVLQTAPGEPLATTLARLAPIAGSAFLLAATIVWLVQRHDYSRSNNGE